MDISLVQTELEQGVILRNYRTSSNKNRFYDHFEMFFSVKLSLLPHSFQV